MAVSLDEFFVLVGLSVRVGFLVLALMLAVIALLRMCLEDRR